MFIFLTIWLPIILALIGIGILLTGWHGRRIDHHPLCPRCGFDLFGKPELTNIVCPECGHKIATPFDVRIGHRTARRGLIYLSLVLLLPSLLMLSIVATLGARGVKWIQIEPVSWLVKTGDGWDAHNEAYTAIEELNRRISTGKLSTQQLNDVLDHALAVQGDMSGMNDPQHLSPPPNQRLWCILVEQARKCGKVSDDRWQRYAEQSVVFVLRVRPHVRRGDAISFALGQWERCSESWFNPMYTIALEIDGQPVQVLPPGYDHPPSIYEDTSLWWFLEPSDRVYQKLADGEHVAKVVLDVHTPGQSARNALMVPGSTKKQISVIRFTIQPADTPSVTTDSDPRLKSQIERWLSRRSVQVAGLGKPNGELWVRLDANSHPPLPIDLAFRVTVRADGNDWPCKLPICFEGNLGPLGSSLTKVSNFRAKTADIILQSDPAAAARTIDIDRIWDGEIVLKDVPVGTR
jgi:hypothetical protein